MCISYTLTNLICRASLPSIGVCGALFFVSLFTLFIDFMKIKQFLSSLGAMALATTTLFAAEIGGDRPLWMRYQSISPDGSRIAFCYRGDIYTVPTVGGAATRLTSNRAYDSNPIWSPDGTRIAFSSNRDGSDDIYIMSATGGSPKRLTYNSAAETPAVFVDNQTILFSASIMPSVSFDLHPSALFAQTYRISTMGGRPELYSSLPMEQISLYNGEILYTDIKGYEDPWRKHHTSSIARDIWHRSKEGRYTKLTSFKGEDRNAVWDKSGGMYYLSEQNGTFNVYHRSSIALGSKEKRITNFSGNPVRFLTMADNGTLCFGYDGELYTWTATQGVRRVPVSISLDDEERSVVPQQLYSGLSSFSLSPGDREIAFVMRGEVYVANTQYGTTKRITNTAEQERDVDFAPDGRSIVYAAERNGQWNIYQASLTRPEDPLFSYANDIKEKQLTNSLLPSQTPIFSPDGKEIAFLRDRTAIVILNLATGKERTILDGKYNYSYSDGDQHFRWSPDGKWILTNYMGDGGWMHVDAAVIKADGSGQMVNLTESGYNEGDASWVMGGKAVLFSSDRAGYRSHGSWGAQRDLYLMFLDHKLYENFRLSKEEKQLRGEIKALEEKERKKKEEEKKKEEDKKKKDDDKNAPKKDDKKDPTKDDKSTSKKDDKKAPAKDDKKEEVLEFSERDNRTIRLTRASGSIGDAIIDKDGKNLYYIATYGTDTDLWVRNLEDHSSRILVRGISYGSLALGKDGRTIYLGAGGGVRKIVGSMVTPLRFTPEFEHKPAAEREYIFNHAWQQVKDKFYDVNLHGVDWAHYKRVYAKFLPHISNDRDFGEMLSELLGELNASHTGARGSVFYVPTQTTAALGAFFDPLYKGDGLRVLEVLKGGPLSFLDKKIKPGAIIEKIDGQDIKAGLPVELLLNAKVGKRVVLTIKDADASKSVEQSVFPISQGAQNELLYRRWLDRRAELVNKWSNGRIGYVYVREMNSPSFREVFRDLMGKYRSCDAVIVDTRYNGGGWLHEDLTFLLSGKKYLEFTPRGRYMGQDPFMQWTKPSCVLMSEGNYSNGHGFPWAYKTLGLGKLIGTPVAGTMTAVWWENQINPAITFGIPQVTCSDLEGRALENMDLMPDIEVYNSPENYLTGEDVQLRRAVEEMLRQVGK